MPRKLPDFPVRCQHVVSTSAVRQVGVGDDGVGKAVGDRRRPGTSGSRLWGRIGSAGFQLACTCTDFTTLMGRAVGAESRR